MLLDCPYFGVPAIHLTLREDALCPTAWTDGTYLGYSPTFVDGINRDELIGLIAHEVLHCAFGHPWRRGSRDPQRWNYACDYAINGILKAAGFKLPKGALLDSQYDGKSSEWIYDRLPAGQQGQNMPGEVRDSPQDASGSSEDASEQDGEETEADGQPKAGKINSEADWKKLAKMAEHVAKSQGKLAGGLERSLGKANKVRVDWEAMLLRYATEACKGDYSWVKPNVRYTGSGLYLPALHSKQMGPLALAIDTSGSIDEVLLSQFVAVAQQIADAIRPSRIDVYSCDAEIGRIDSFERGEDIVVKPSGGGGTDFRPVFDAIADSCEAPTVLIYLTDMYGSFPEAEPDYPVIWCATSDVVGPFGETVKCE